MREGRGEAPTAAGVQQQTVCRGWEGSGGEKELQKINYIFCTLSVLLSIVYFVGFHGNVLVTLVFHVFKYGDFYNLYNRDSRSWTLF